MPYIKEEERHWMRIPCNAGGLNYKLTMICLSYLHDKGECYQTYAEIVSALECAKLEMYRRQIAPYEDSACMRNGEVYPCKNDVK